MKFEKMKNLKSCIAVVVILLAASITWGQPRSGVQDLEKKLKNFNQVYSLDSGRTQFSKVDDSNELQSVCSLQFFSSQSDPTNQQDEKLVVVFSHPGIMMGSYIFSSFYNSDGNQDGHRLVIGSTLNQMRSDESFGGYTNMYEITTLEDDFGLTILGSHLNTTMGTKRYACFFSKK